jgi:predicted transcriptional regulator
MNMLRKLFIVALPFLLLSCSRSLPPVAEKTAEQSEVLDLQAIEKMVTNQQASQEALNADLGEYAWGLFLQLNNPWIGTAPKLWESWRQTSTVFLPDGSRPLPWGQDTVPEEVKSKAQNLATSDCATTGVLHNLDTKIQVDGLVLLNKWNQEVRYQLLMNQPTFDYVVARGFYNVNGQESATQPANFPWTAYELKTSWIWIGTDESKCAELKDKYYIVAAYYQVFNNDGQPQGWEVGYAALTGMHIINKTIPNWVWITFENVNNPDFTQVKLELEVPSYAKAANDKYQPALQAIGSIFANYQLDGVQLAFTEPDGTETLLANSNIESAFQKQSSCITCHALASIKPDGEYFNMVNSQGGDVGYYIGEPPDVGAMGFNPLDFVWSMKRAHRLRTPPTQ